MLCASRYVLSVREAGRNMKGKRCPILYGGVAYVGRRIRFLSMWEFLVAIY